MKIISIDGMVCCGDNHWMYPEEGQKYFNIALVLQDECITIFRSSCKHMHLSYKSVCNKEQKGVICNMTPMSNSSQSTYPTGQVQICKELLVLPRFH